MSKNTSTFDCDIFIAGGGVAGLAAAAVFGAAGFSVVCADPTPPVTERSDTGADLRTTALLQPAQALLAHAGVWDHVADEAAPLQVMRIVDAGGATPEARVIKDFDAADVSDQPFGWNVPNWVLRRGFLDRFKALKNVDFRPGVAVTSVFTREAEARVGLSDGARARSRLVVAADGRNSFVRQAAGIGVKTTRFGQKALSFAVTHDLPHENISTEIHRTGGPFTLVPLPDYEGQPSSAVVWMEQGAEAKRLSTLTPDAFEKEINARSCGLYGPLKLVSDRMVWPIISQLADRMWAQRVALVAEAAHVVPPIGAQGLNMSLSDISVMLDLIQAEPDRLGHREMLKSYHRRRYADVAARVTGISALNRASMVQSPVARDARALGVQALHTITPIRKTLMQLGLGVREDRKSP